MAIGNVKDIENVKNILKRLNERNIISRWELPYENVLTKLSAAIFFLSPVTEKDCTLIWETLGQIPGLEYRVNNEKELSELEYRITFNEIRADRNERK